MDIEASNPELLSSQNLALELESRFNESSKRTYYSFLNYLRTKVTPEYLVADRVAQANLRYYLRPIGEINSPYPKLEATIKTKKGYFPEYGGFQLKDDTDYIYFIPTEFPRKTDDFLRPDDIVPFEEFGFPKYPKVKAREPGMNYTSSLRRVSVRGGVAMRFNYIQSDWEYVEENKIYGAVDKILLSKTISKLVGAENFSITDNLVNNLKILRHKFKG